MKNKVIQSTLISSAILFSVSAMASDHNAPLSKVERHQNVAMSLGGAATIGALSAGPVGAVVGGIIGIFIGEDINNKEQGKRLTAQLAEKQEALSTREAQLLALQQEYQNTLVALERLQTQQNGVQVAAMPRNTSPVELQSGLSAEANIQFKTASWQLEQHYAEPLDKVAEQLRANDKLVVQLFGYADRRGDEDYNLQLSEKRADQVKRYLLSKGVDGRQIETAGYGEAQPVTFKQTWENDFFDRRVVVRLSADSTVMTARQ